VQSYEHVSQMTQKEIIKNNFIGGVAWAAGTIVGAVVLVAVLGFIAQYINVIPFIGDFLADLLYYLQFKGAIER